MIKFLHCDICTFTAEPPARSLLFYWWWCHLVHWGWCHLVHCWWWCHLVHENATLLTWLTIKVSRLLWLQNNALWEVCLSSHQARWHSLTDRKLNSVSCFTVKWSQWVLMCPHLFSFWTPDQQDRNTLHSCDSTLKWCNKTLRDITTHLLLFSVNHT